MRYKVDISTCRKLFDIEREKLRIAFQNAAIEVLGGRMVRIIQVGQTKQKKGN